MGPMTGAQNGSLIEEQTRRSIVKREAEIFYLEFNSRNLWKFPGKLPNVQQD